MSGKPPGRPLMHVSAEDKRRAAADEAIRNRVEGKFGQGKRRFGLSRVMAKLASTSASQISLTFLVMNFELALKRLFFSILLLCHSLARLVFARHTACLRPFRTHEGAARQFQTGSPVDRFRLNS